MIFVCPLTFLDQESDDQSSENGSSSDEGFIPTFPAPQKGFIVNGLYMGIEGPEKNNELLNSSPQTGTQD